MATRIEAGSVDMSFTDNGDLEVASEVDPAIELVAPGDMSVVTALDLDIYRQALLNRFMTNPGEYIFNRVTGVGFKQFLGAPNDAETGASIKAAVVAEITRDNLIPARNLDVKVFPTSRHAVGVIVTVTGLPSTLSARGFVLGFTYDMRFNQVKPRRLT